MSEMLGYKCPNCNATLIFDAKSGNMRCEYCESEFEPDTLKAYDEVLNEEKSTEDQKDPEWADVSASEEEWNDEDKAVFVCKFCGAELVTDASTAATVCPYCGNATVLAGRLSGVLKPELVIPFTKTEEDAKAALRSFCHKKPLLPKNFLSDHRLESLKGIYVPFWLFDTEADARYTYNATRVRSFRQGDYRVTDTFHYLVRRAGEVGFEQIPADGSSKMNDAYMEAIEPFDYSHGVDFATAYLSGYLADKYDVGSEEVRDRVNRRITESSARLFRETVKGYATVTQRSSNIKLRNGRVRYALLPVYIMNTEYEGKTYTFAMNGDSGRFVGELPVCRRRLAAWFAGIAAASTALLSAIVALAML